MLPYSIGAGKLAAMLQFKDLMEFKQAMDRNRLKALDELSAVDQKLGLGY
jgi:hypothetical protein